MLNEILNKREDREVWRTKKQIETGKLKKNRCMIDFPVFVGGFLFALEIGTEHRTVQRPIEVLAKTYNVTQTWHLF